MHGIVYHPISTKVAVDTGTSNISGPGEDIPRLNQFLKQHCDSFSEYEKGYSSKVSIEFVINGESWELNVPRRGNCGVDINVIDVDPPRGPMWIFGNEFIKK